jgi:hypothetical protein
MPRSALPVKNESSRLRVPSVRRRLPSMERAGQVPWTFSAPDVAMRISWVAMREKSSIPTSSETAPGIMPMRAVVPLRVRVPGGRTPSPNSGRLRIDELCSVSCSPLWRTSSWMSS